MDTEMAEDLGVFIDSSGGEVSTPLPTLSSSSEDVTTVFWEGYEVACYLRDFMDKSTNIDGTSKNETTKTLCYGNVSLLLLPSPDGII